MSRIRALNQESSDESENEEDGIPSVTREAQEQHAFSEYRTALLLLGEKKIEQAKEILENLLQGDVLQEVNEEDSSGHPLALLKYSCLKNMGTIFVQQQDYMNALMRFIQATQLDSSDVMLWYHLGCSALNLNNLVLARDAFMEGLQQSAHNWLCLDKVVSVLYALGDYVLCLLFISRAFDLDSDYVKGHVVRDAIFEEYPFIRSEYSDLLGNVTKLESKLEYDHEVGQEVMTEIKQLQAARQIKIQDNEEKYILKPIPLDQPVITPSWFSLGKSLLHQYKSQKESLACPLKLMQSMREQNVTVEEESVNENRAVPPNIDEQQECQHIGVLPTDQIKSENQMEEADLTPSQENDDIKCRKRRRNSLSFLAQWVWGGKRRSARVRSTVRRETEREEYNLEEALRRLMPASLLPSSQKEGKPKDVELIRSNDDSMDTMDLYKLFEHRESTENHGVERNDKKTGESDSTQREEGYFGSEREKTDVENFMSRFNNCDIIDALENFLKEICDKWSQSWPKGLVQIYLEAYEMRRKHIAHPYVLGSGESVEWIQMDAWITLLYEELSLDCWLQERFGDKKSEQGCDGRCIPFDIIGYLEMAYSGTLLKGNYVFLRRGSWLKAHMYLNNGNIEAAAGCLELIVRHLESCKDISNPTIILKNCSHNNVISEENVQNLLTSLFRTQNLSNIQYLYDEKRYKEIVDILKETFNYSQQPGLSGSYNNSGNNCPDRATQLGMLMDALWQLKCYQDCFHWGEACCNETLNKYLNSEEREQQKWATALEKLLAGMESCVVKAGLSVVDVPRLPRLVQNLTHIVCHQIESPETIISMPIESVTPWILLQQVLQWQEEKGTAISEEEDELPAYISILFTAHEFLSRRSWCCSNEGALLLHAMDVVIPRMHNPELRGVHDKLVQGMEQVFYCLYAHPSKKTKRGSLQDHGVPPVRLTWEHSLKLFTFYLPKELPEFDSYRVASITADVEVLLKRIIDLVPPECNPATMTEKMLQYIRGDLAQVPCPPGGYIPLPRQITSIYYLLGDYYFKNSEWVKAIQHYLLDICVNPVRLDSWAGMALARGSLLETKLNSCEVLKSESEFVKQAKCAERCYQRALEIEPKHSLLWIEYGAFVYMVHSFCSRLLKQETDSLNLEMFELLENQKEEMLTIAIQCFTTANKVWYALGEESGLQDERWLHHYMLGKAAEKNNLEARVYLDHYSKAFYFLYINGASNARKINYSNPPNLSVEFLEVFYRIHASVLKWLEQNEGKLPDHAKYTLFLKSLKEAQEGPFSLKYSEESERQSEYDKSKMMKIIGPVEDFPSAKALQTAEDCRQQSAPFMSQGQLNSTLVCGKMSHMPWGREKRGQGSFLPPSSTRFQDQGGGVEEGGIVCGSRARYQKYRSSIYLEVLRKPENASDSRLMEDIIDLMEDMISKVEILSANEKSTADPFQEGHSRTNKLHSKKAHSKIESTRDSVVVHGSQVPSSQKDTSQTGSVKLEGNSPPVRAVAAVKDGDAIEKDIEQQHQTSEHLSSNQNNTTDSKTNNSPEDLKSVRRSSQESSTSATTETSGANSSSSDDSSSSTDSSESLSSSSSDSSSDESEASQSNEDVVRGMETKEKVKCEADGTGQPAAEEFDLGDDFKNVDWKQVYDEITERCLIGLEECVLRFPQHYKSLYRLTHYYFRSKKLGDKAKCRDLLLGTYTCQSVSGRHTGTCFQGLFAERKNNNFFNGVWRIPVPEIDRPGSFASHMSRCVLLLMDVLLDSRDNSMLLELCLQLRRTPEADKKYLRDSEREQLSRQALSLAIQTLRTKIQDTKESPEQVMFDAYRAFQRVQKHLPQKESTFTTLLLDAYKRLKKVETADVDQVLQHCQHELSALRTTPTATPAAVGLAFQTSSASNSFIESTQHSPSTALPNVSAKALLQTSLQAPSPSRPRGRPPGSTKLALTENIAETSHTKPPSAKNISNWSASVPKTFQSPVLPSVPSTSNMSSNYRNLHSVFSDPHFLTAAMNADPRMLDPQVALNFFQAQMTSYQELLRQMSSGQLGSYPPVSSSFGFGSVPGINYSQPTSNTSAPSTSSMVSNYVKDRPNISITPIPSTKHTIKTLSSHNSGQNTSTNSFIPHSQEKSSPQALNVSMANSKFTESKYSTKNKEGNFAGGVSRNQGLSIRPSSSSHTPPKNSSPKKSTPYKTSQVILENVGNAYGVSGDHTSIGSKNESKSPLKRAQIESQDIMNKTYLSDSCHQSNRSNAGHPLLMPPDVSSTPVSVLQHTKSKRLQVPPLASVDRSLSIHPVLPPFKQTSNVSTDENILSGGSYIPPVKKVKDSVSIVEVPRAKVPGKKPQALPKKEEPKQIISSSVEIITLE